MSLPPRERGLKLAFSIASLPPILSLPPRERGLKLINESILLFTLPSLPPRERGLKHRPILYDTRAARRSPRGSAD